MLPSVSIGIPTFNRPEMTRRAVASVMAQDYPGAVEACVYIDGPDDDTPLALGDLIYVPGLRLLHVDRGTVNRGIAYAKNQALRLGASELRGILDSDDWYEPTFVSRCVAALGARPETVAVYTDNWRAHPDGSRRLEAAEDWSIGALLRCRLRGDTFLARWAVLARTALHDERFELDADYCLYNELARQGPLYRLPEPLVVCTEHPDRTSQRDMARVAYWHAACLAKYGHPKRWALDRAAGHPEWLAAIDAGYAHGETLR